MEIIKLKSDYFRIEILKKVVQLMILEKAKIRLF